MTERLRPTTFERAALTGSYVYEFTVCGFVGWLYEVTVMYVMYHSYEERGYLHLPILPIYGFFGLILVAVFRKRSNVLLVFFASMAITTAGELAASYIIEAVIHEQLWSYHMWRFNFQGRISLYSSLMFGGLSVLLVKAVHPLIRLMHKHLPEAVSLGLGIACLTMIGTDLLMTLKG
ncbi:MAG: putative ABC transporter permease [Ruminococcus sp.]|nr:putative ABC transporter permease [Ruminococcus sp.]